MPLTKVVVAAHHFGWPLLPDLARAKVQQSNSVGIRNAKPIEVGTAHSMMLAWRIGSNELLLG
jgi:hypothetical protein